MNKYTVISDSREKNGYTFPANDHCDGTIVKGLKTGDYSLVGFEDSFAIERKGGVAEFSGNLTDPRFFRELERFDSIRHGFLVLEFYLDDIMMFPATSGIPKNKLQYIKVTPNFLLMKTMEIQVKYNIKTLFVGPYFMNVSQSLFKRIVENTK